MHRMVDRCLVCTCCGESKHVGVGEWNDAATLRRLRREMEEDHEVCKPFEGNPERARAERVFREGIRRHCMELEALRAEVEGI